MKSLGALEGFMNWVADRKWNKEATNNKMTEQTTTETADENERRETCYICEAIGFGTGRIC